MPDLTSPTVTMIRSVLEWLLFSIGMWKLSGKMKWQRRWLAWIPALRYYAWGQSMDMTGEGIACCVFELLVYVNNAAISLVENEKVSIALMLVALVFTVFLIVYRIRLFLRLLNEFGLKKLWVLLWLAVEWLPIMIFGFGKRYQPKGVRAEEEWQAGTAPAELAGVSGIHSRPPLEKGLSVDLRERTAKDGGKTRYLLKDIALDIPNGSLVLLLGGSGSGKTTLVNAIIGYEKADATMTLNGSDIYKDYAQMKYSIGFVPQKNLIRGNDTVLRTISDAAEIRLPRDTGGQERKSKMQEVMDLLGLTAGADGLVCKKSGGQLRRISIAMELVSDPELFVLDEPDSGLDGVIAREIFTKLRAIADEGRIVIVITHTPDRVIDLFDKVIVLGRDSGRVGRLAFYGSPQEAREFFGKETMEGVVMSVNRKEEGGDGLADECIERYARLVAAAAEGGVAQ
jgi:ABC-type multidrug transport system ATPase subunit